MQDQLRQAIKKLEHSPSEGLFRVVMARIADAEIRQARTRSLLFGVLTVVSLAVAVVMFGYAVQEFAQSEFLQYFSLVFSDAGAVLASWKEFILLLAESVPLTGLILALVATFVSFSSIKAVIIPSPNNLIPHNPKILAATF